MHIHQKGIQGYDKQRYMEKYKIINIPLNRRLVDSKFDFKKKIYDLYRLFPDDTVHNGTIKLHKTDEKIIDFAVHVSPSRFDFFCWSTKSITNPIVQWVIFLKQKMFTEKHARQFCQFFCVWF